MLRFLLSFGLGRYNDIHKSAKLRSPSVADVAFLCFEFVRRCSDMAALPPGKIQPVDDQTESVVNICLAFLAPARRILTMS